MTKPLGELNGSWSFLFKVNLIIIPTMLTAFLTVCGYLFNTTQSNKIDIARLQETSLTVKEGGELKEAIQNLTGKLDVVTSRLPKSFPIPETKKAIEDLQQRLNKIERKLDL